MTETYRKYAPHTGTRMPHRRTVPIVSQARTEQNAGAENTVQRVENIEIESAQNQLQMKRQGRPAEEAPFDEALVEEHEV